MRIEIYQLKILCLAHTEKQMGLRCHLTIEIGNKSKFFLILRDLKREWLPLKSLHSKLKDFNHLDLQMNKCKKLKTAFIIIHQRRVSKERSKQIYSI